MIPHINDTGIFVVLPPYQLTPQEEYVCTEILDLKRLSLSTGTAYESYYEPVGVSFANYARDIDEPSSAIVGLTDTGGETVFIPSSYIASAPLVRAVDYSRTYITLDMGIIPDGLLSDDVAMSDIVEIITAITGIVPEVKTHRSDREIYITEAEHAIKEAVRLVGVQLRPSLYAGKITAERRATKLANDLEAFQEIALNL